jgi:hypothetical protein
MKEAVTDWPEDPNTMLKMSEIIVGLRAAFNQAVTIKKPLPPIVWTGIQSCPIVEAVYPSPADALDQSSLERNRENGRDVLDVLILLAVQLGMEQGARHERWSCNRGKTTESSGPG